MTVYDAVNHSLTTMATGGFSTKNASAAHYDTPFIQYTLIVFMFLAGTSFTLTYYALKRNFKKVFKNEEFIVYSLLHYSNHLSGYHNRIYCFWQWVGKIIPRLAFSSGIADYNHRICIGRLYFLGSFPDRIILYPAFCRWLSRLYSRGRKSDSSRCTLQKLFFRIEKTTSSFGHNTSAN